MGNDQGALQVKAEPPAPDVTPDQRSPSAEEAQTESPKLDSTLNSQHGTPKIEIQERAWKEESMAERLKPSDGPVFEASTTPELDTHSNPLANENDLFTTEEEDDSDNATGISFVQKPMRKTLKQRIKEAPRTFSQCVEYAKIVEDRLADVERRLDEIESQRPNRIEVKESVKSPESPESSEPKKKYTEILGVNRVTFERYKPNKPSNPKPRAQDLQIQHELGPIRLPELPQPHIVDIVIPHISASESLQSTSNMKVSGVNTTTKVSPSGGAAEVLAVQDTQHVVPERIRINSSLLLQTLEKITGCNFTRPQTYGLERELKTQVFLRPFKLLVTYEEKIRRHFRDLKGKHALLHARGSVPTSTVGANGDMSPEEGSRSKKSSSDNLAKNIAENDTIPADDSNEEPERRLQELQVLVEVLDNDLKPVFDLRRRIQEGDIRSIAFCDLWHLFRIDGEIRANDGHPQVYRIADIGGGRPSLCSRTEAEKWDHDSYLETHENFGIQSACYAFDGMELNYITRKFIIRKYDDLKPITSLPVYPVEFSGTDEGDLKRESFVRRGRKFVELTKDKSSVVHKRYHGLAMNLEELREEVNSEVIIDISMALLKNPSLEIKFDVPQDFERSIRETLEFLDPDGCLAEGCHQNTAIHQDYEIDNKCRDTIPETWMTYQDLYEGAKSMPPKDLIICPCMVFGYVLRSRKWASLDIQLVEDIAVLESGFESLVLPKGHAETLLALVETHSKGAKATTRQKFMERQVDLVRGKGKGLIILLHGEPGVGKTSTAECVAEYTQRPLFQVTCGDLGSSAEVVERTLENHFQLAHKWGCVLLLDEADVFLMARSEQDLKRNAIVSVFLRVLEYYSGILFLTTNRVGTFDPAFRSRIHMSFFYPKLDLKATLKIWAMNLDRTRKLWAENIEIDPQEREKILAFAEEHFKDSEKLKTTWNGRQIRNAFQTAIALAEYEISKAQKRFKMAEVPVPRLEARQFEKVAEASKHFDEYIKETVGLEEDRARENFERRDDLAVTIRPGRGKGKERRREDFESSE